ncbi:acetyltransferase [Streptomyces cellostaticus]|uniref:Acetyltransferase n=1 Tax=Streptomyces cellostaticus TaxID=67285 RepID=A0A101NRL5_9ACTN|nr:GNAT family N-acetyltransferase [Streptomyces cellostaticus]KUM97772.1 acetyltransferase [Streptomyces cellostaticus]GHI08266.1 N-acetyltransferase [Streptomyces cellostaticus]
MPEPYIRIALPEDDQELTLLDKATWSTLHAVVPEPQPPYDPFFGDRHTPEDTLVAELGGRVVGYVLLGFPTPLAANAHVRQIQGLAVHDDARGKGVGRALIRAAVEQARARGARRITLRVLGHNTPARRLYESEGFVVEGVLPEEFLLRGKYADDVFMGRSL